MAIASAKEDSGKCTRENYSSISSCRRLLRLDRTYGQGNTEFWKEIIALSLYKHENIVSLLGFCDEKILVYEYVSRGSLDLYLNRDDLTWIQRLKICIGAARGLAYLHDAGTTQQRLLHRDIKSSNILLDESWNAKISDLGLSKFGPANQQYSFLVSDAVGTPGYCDPEYVKEGLLTKESDTYSFGVVLFEILSGRLCFRKNMSMALTKIFGNTEFWKENKIKDIIHGSLKDEINPRSLDAFTTIAYQCLRSPYKERPLMTKVVRILENALAYQLGGASNEEYYDDCSHIQISESSDSSSRQPIRVTVPVQETSLPRTVRYGVRDTPKDKKKSVSNDDLGDDKNDQKGKGIVSDFPGKVGAEAISTSEKKYVFKLDLYDDRVIKSVSTLAGVESISVDMKRRKMTITGDVDVVAVTSKLRKVCNAELLEVSNYNKEDDRKEAVLQKSANYDKKKQVQKEKKNDTLGYKYYVNYAEAEPKTCTIC